MPDLKEATKIILSSIEAMNDKWRLGHTKVFFRAGAVGCVEESREECIKAILNYIQGLARGYTGRSCRMCGREQGRMHQGYPQLHPRLGKRLHWPDGVQEADLQEGDDSNHAEEHEEVSVLPRLDVVLPDQWDQTIYRSGRHGGCDCKPGRRGSGCLQGL